jgi:signal transduction histidine kinase
MAAANRPSVCRVGSSRGRLEKAYAGRRDGEDDQALISETLADLDSVLRMFTSLTRISQIESSDRMAGFSTVNLAHIAREVVELFDAAAEEKGTHLSAVADDRVRVTGDRDLLFDAMANLIDNAIKHGRDAGRVTVEVVQENGRAVVSIADDGPGIAVHEGQQVFKRFYRLNAAAMRPGTGWASVWSPRWPASTALVSRWQTTPLASG